MYETSFQHLVLAINSVGLMNRHLSTNVFNTVLEMGSTREVRNSAARGSA